ncbi:SIR2 family NAD-dependent protein deacylase [Mycobacterium colombiense]|uniref:SIR2 family NAD-dependent protein deacylase n=1 Tax=Mycobacterium colombiense TaxID=339268 RepID=UPI0015BE3355|nr:SIR2 family protein [Mycobacterium colombiense]
MDEIKDAVASGTALVMLGTGFSSAVSADPKSASWLGLLKAGVDYLRTNGLATDAACASIEANIKLGETEDGTFLLAAGQVLSDLMHRDSSPHFSSFLDATVGKLEVDKSKIGLAESIESLQVPILTTNYDTLYEQAVTKPSATWRDTRKFRSAILGESHEVVHLHGIWDNPETVILTSRDYERIIHDLDATALRQAVGVLRTVVFIGYGAGLDDPHFEQLWKWLHPLLPQGIKHYVLCLQKNLQDLATANADRAVIPVPYGDDYADLPNFIASLAPPKSATSNTLQDPRVLAQTAQTCRLKIIDLLTDSTVMPGIIENPDEDYDVDDLVIAPVLLPVPQEQYIAERAGGNEDLKPLDGVSEVCNNDSLVIVGEEQSGVTTALAWAALIRARSQPGSIPVFLDYKQIGTGNRRVQNAVRKYLRGAGAPINNREPLPEKLVIVVDNVTAANDRDLIYTIEDLRNNFPSSAVFLGCRHGVEIPLQAKFAEMNADLCAAYLGRMNRRQTIELAKRVDPDRAETLADKVLKIVRKEGIARTPLCLILLIVGTINEDAWISAVSNTTFVDSFVDSLLGRGSLRDDMHLSIDAAGYSRVLESFAKKLIEDDSASASWVDTINFIDEVVRSLDWSDNPNDILDSLIAKGVLVNREGQVQFRQPVYLHIFAARRCRSDEGLRKKLRERPLYYASVIRHYAALQRDDEVLLQWAVDWMTEIASLDVTPDGIFRQLDADELKRKFKALKEVSDKAADAHNGQGDGPGVDESGGESTEVSEGTDGKGDEKSTELARMDEDDFDPFDLVADDKRAPFPALELDSAPLEVRLPAHLALVSNILRDSEQVQDAQLKGAGLVRALRGWGLWMSTVYDSEGVARMTERFVDLLSESNDITPARRSELSAQFVELWSVVSGATGLGEELATIKLERALNRILEEPANADSMQLVIPAVMLKRHTNGGRITNDIRNLLLKYSDHAITRVYVDIIVRIDYVSAPTGSRLADELEQFIIDFELYPHRELSHEERERMKNQLLLQLRSIRLRTPKMKELVDQAVDDPDDEAI